MYPLHDMSTWPIVEGLAIEPPTKRERVSRPKIKRTREQGDMQGNKKSTI